MNEDIYIILLAAGKSRRMGRTKAFLPVQGDSLIRHVTKKAVAVQGCKVAVVCGDEADELQNHLADLHVSFIHNPNALLGISTSIGAGIRYVMNQPEASAAVIILADQPDIDPQVIERVIEAYRLQGAGAVQARYAGHPGHPLLFAKSLFPALLQLRGDQGAKKWLEQRHSDVHYVDVVGSLPIDLDTPQDYAAYVRQEAQFYPLGDAAIVVQFGQSMDRHTFAKVRHFTRLLDLHPFAGMVEYVPSFYSVTIYFDSFQVYYAARDDSPYETVRAYLQQLIQQSEPADDVAEADTVEIPVCYGGTFGPDLEMVAAHHQLSTDEVIRIHTEAEYFVHMIGFAPGFPYLSGMDASIATPRRATPRLQIPAGTVGIAGMQTGIYPMDTPGGWQLIGRTPLPLFLPAKNPPTLLQAGQIVKFLPISPVEFAGWKERSS